ncbi:MAG: PDZ domain-containing protein, partial [Candidatus Moraniibacteriota bacterium]
MEEFEISPNEELAENRIIFKKALLFFFVLLLMFGSYLLGLKRGENNETISSKGVSLELATLENTSPPEGVSVDFGLFWKTWNILKERHIDRDKLDAQKMVYGAISGMLKATGDPYTSFFDPEEKKAFSEDLGGSFEGIGAELSIKDNLLTVIAPLDESPAQKAGLRAGDRILKIDDKIISDMTIDESVSLIRGKKGTEVRLTILPKEDQNTKEITIVRNTIEVKSVKLEFKDGGIAVIEITKFGENTDKEFN